MGFGVFFVLLSLCFRVCAFLSENLCSEVDFCACLLFQADKQTPLAYFG